MILRDMKILLVASVAAWGLVGAFGNLAHWSGTLEAVGAATSMATFEGGAESWKATTNSVVIWIGALFIMLSKVVTGLSCGVGARHMWGARKGDPDAFHAAKQWALAGCAVAVFMLFFGFIVIAESWFELWQSDVLRAPVLASAFRYGGMIALIALFVAMRDD